MGKDVSTTSKTHGERSRKTLAGCIAIFFAVIAVVAVGGDAPHATVSTVGTSLPADLDVNVVDHDEDANAMEKIGNFYRTLARQRPKMIKKLPGMKEPARSKIMRIYGITEEDIRAAAVQQEAQQ